MYCQRQLINSTSHRLYVKQSHSSFGIQSVRTCFILQREFSTVISDFLQLTLQWLSCDIYHL